jgi:hypothetical protein
VLDLLFVPQEDAADEAGIVALRKRGLSEEEIVRSKNLPVGRFWAAGCAPSLLRQERGEEKGLKTQSIKHQDYR